MATMTNKRLTPKQRAERDAARDAREAARKADEIASYRTDHIANASAQKVDASTKDIVGSTMSLYGVASDLRKAGQPQAAALVTVFSRAVFEYQQARDTYDRELRRTAERVESLRREFDSGYLSRGVRLGGEDVAEALGVYRSAANTLAQAAYHAGYRVPAIEGEAGAAANDKRAAISVQPIDESSFVVCRDGVPVTVDEVATAASALRYLDADDVKPWLAEHVDVPTATYRTYDAAWQAVGALCGAWLY